MPTPLQRFLIAPLKSGEQNNIKPWLIADDAYEVLRNAYTWRGRVKKRVGAWVMDQGKPEDEQQQFTRLRILINTTDPITGNAAGTVPGTIFSIGQMFSIGADTFTVNQFGTPSNLLFAPGAAIVATYDTTTGAYVFTGAAMGVPVYFYPATPVMAIQLYNFVAINDERTIAFDTQFSYEWTLGTGWNRSGLATQGLWSGTDSQFHWTTNWRGVSSSSYLMYVVNNNIPDGIQYFDGTNWFVLAPPLLTAGGNTLLTALMVVPFKYRLLFLNITQFTAGVGNQTFAARVVFSWNQNPLDVNAWKNKTSSFLEGSVHAKVAVADRNVCFITSANLTGYAMTKNMEAGVLLTGGDVPKLLHDHLEALVETNIISNL